VPHIYTDGISSHVVRVFDLSDGIRGISVGTNLLGCNLIVTSRTRASSFTNNFVFVAFSTGEAVILRDGRFCVRLSSGGSTVYIPADRDLGNGDGYGFEAGDEIRLPYVGTVTSYVASLPLAYRLGDQEVD
jgi:hypothetical protein